MLLERSELEMLLAILLKKWQWWQNFIEKICNSYIKLCLIERRINAQNLYRIIKCTYFLCKLITLNLWGKVGTKNLKTGLPDL